MKCLLTVLLFIICFGVQAQYDPSKVKPRAAQLYAKALEMAEGDNFKQGIETLQQAVKIDSTFADAYLSLAGMYGEIKNYQRAIDNYEKAKNIDSVYFIDYTLSYS